MRTNRFARVAELYNRGITDNKAIAKIMRIAEKTAIQYVCKARKEGLIKKISRQQEFYKKIVDLYISGIQDPNEIAKEVGLKPEGVARYLTMARQEGIIGPKEKRHRYKEVIRLYNEGMKAKEIATIVGLTVATVKKYLHEAKSKGEINSEVSNYEEVIRLYNEGMKAKEIAKKLHMSESTVNNYIMMAKNAGNIQDKPSLYRNVVYWHNQGKGVKEIAEILGVSQNKIEKHLSRARKEGQLNDSESYKTEQYKKIVELYKQGKNAEEISGIVGLALATVRAHLSIARRVGDIPKEKSKYEKVIELWLQGLRDRDEIANIVGLTRNTINAYLRRASKEGKIIITDDAEKLENITESKQLTNVAYRTEELARSARIEISLAKAILNLLPKKYPTEVANTLRIEPDAVYNVMENMNKTERAKMNREFLNNNTVYGKVIELVDSGVEPMEAIKQVKLQIKGLDLIEMLDFYYILGGEKECQKVIAKIMKQETPEFVRKVAKNKIVALYEEFEARKSWARRKREAIKGKARNNNKTDEEPSL